MVIDSERLPSAIFIGRTGENEFRPIEISVSTLLAKYPNANFYMVFHRPDGQIYPLPSSVINDVLTWTPTSTDLAFSGNGKIEFRLMLNGIIGKSSIINTITEKSLDPAGIVPQPPSPDWVQTVLNAADEVENNVDGFDAHVVEKTTEFDSNATEKQALVDAKAQEADQSAKDAQAIVEGLNITKGYDGTVYLSAQDRLIGDMNNAYNDLDPNRMMLPYSGTSIYAQDSLMGYTEGLTLKGNTLNNILSNGTATITENTQYTFIPENVDGVAYTVADDIGTLVTDVNVSTLITTNTGATTVTVMASDSTIHNNMLIQGDHTAENLPYFEGIQSCILSEVKSTGKNLFNKSKIQGKFSESSADGSTADAFGETENGFTFSTTNQFEGVMFRANLGKSKQIALKYNRDKDCRVLIKPINDEEIYEYLSTAAVTLETNLTFATLDTYDDYWIIFDDSFKTLGDFNITNVQLEQGNIPTDYADYVSDTIILDPPVELRRLPNGVTDSVSGDAVTRTIGSRAYQAGDETNPDVVTDMTTTLYALTTPEIEIVSFGELQTYPEATHITNNSGIPCEIDAKVPTNVPALLASKNAEIIALGDRLTEEQKASVAREIAINAENEQRFADLDSAVNDILPLVL